MPAHGPARTSLSAHLRVTLHARASWGKAGTALVVQPKRRPRAASYRVAHSIRRAPRGDEVFVLRAAWPRYACNEHGGAGWAASIVRATPHTCTVSFKYATSQEGLQCADERVPRVHLRRFA